MRARDSGITESRTAGRPCVTIGRILGTHGVRGAVKVESYSDVPGRFEGLRSVMVSGEHLVVSERRRVAKGYVLSFETVDSPEKARGLVGSTLEIPEEPLPAGVQDRYYECQLVGLQVFTEEGSCLGRLREVLSTPGNAIFVVEGETGVEHLIPGTREIVRLVDVEHGRLVVRCLPGLIESDDAS